MSFVDAAEMCLKKGGHVHLVGVGGIGMSGLAFLLQERGLKVSGCDLQENRQTAWLQKEGIDFVAEHAASHIDETIDWVIRTTAVPETHPEIIEAKKLGIPVSRRGEVLPALMRDRTCVAICGTHGKTTTTAILAQLLDCGYFVGGEIVGLEGVSKDGDLMLVEADESDGTVAGYTPDYAIITNIEYDHMEHHESAAAFIGCFEQLIQNTKKTVYYCGSDPIAQQLCEPYAKCTPYYKVDGGIDLPLLGEYNQWNAAGALAVAKHFKAEADVLEAMRSLKPLRRRFETVYDANEIRIISDYAHHPTEIKNLVQTALELKPKRLLGVFQPHRYTRTLALGEQFPAGFTGIDSLWIAPVYAASEQPLKGGTSADLVSHFSSDWAGRLQAADSLESAWNELQDELQPGDLLLIIGAGDIEQIAEWARAL